MSGFTAVQVANALSYGPKTAKRVRWEAWSFRIVGPHKIEVTNESYGFKKDEHRYVVTVEDNNGLFVPVECECSADKHNGRNACKHRVAVATVGGPLVLGAAMAYSSDEPRAPLHADGGLSEVRRDSTERLNPEAGAGE